MNLYSLFQNGIEGRLVQIGVWALGVITTVYLDLRYGRAASLLRRLTFAYLRLRLRLAARQQARRSRAEAANQSLKSLSAASPYLFKPSRDRSKPNY